MTHRDTFQTADVVKILKIPRQRLRVWLNRGWVKASEPARGQGQRNVFTLADLYEIAFFKSLVDDAHIECRTAALFINGLKAVKQISGLRANASGRFILVTTDIVTNRPVLRFFKSQRDLLAGITKIEESWKTAIIVDFERITKAIP
jgi:hypothetical protein